MDTPESILIRPDPQLLLEREPGLHRSDEGQEIHGRKGARNRLATMVPRKDFQAYARLATSQIDPSPSGHSKAASQVLSRLRRW